MQRLHQNFVRLKCAYNINRAFLIVGKKCGWDSTDYVQYSQTLSEALDHINDQGLQVTFS